MHRRCPFLWQPNLSRPNPVMTEAMQTREQHIQCCQSSGVALGTHPRTVQCAELCHTAPCRGSHAAGLILKDQGLWLWATLSLMLVVASSCSAFWEGCWDLSCLAGGCGSTWSSPRLLVQSSHCSVWWAKHHFRLHCRGDQPPRVTCLSLSFIVTNQLSQSRPSHSWWESKCRGC